MTQLYYVKPRIFFANAIRKRLQSSVFDEKSESKIEPGQSKKAMKAPIKLDEEEKKTMFAPAPVTLSTEMKFEVAKFPMKDRTIAKDCAYVLEEMLQNIESYDPEEEGDFRLLRNINQKIVNKAMIEKEKLEMNEQTKKIRDSVDFQLRDHFLKRQIKKHKKQKKLKAKEESAEKKKNAASVKEQEDLKKKREEERIKQIEEQYAEKFKKIMESH